MSGLFHFAFENALCFMKRILLLISIFLILICNGCSSGQDAIRYAPSVEASSPVATVSVLPSAVPATPVPTAEPTPVPTPSPSPSPDPLAAVRARIADMAAEEKLGQLVMFGFSGTGSVSSEFATLLQDYKIGNVILYGANIDREQSDGGFSLCKKLTGKLQSLNTTDIPLMISIDVEGGNVTRFHWPFTLSSAASLGKKNNYDTAFTQFKKIGERLCACGISLDLAPVMDTAKSPSDTFLGTRIISSDASIAANIGSACIAGLHEGGCLSLVKHFPGHGATKSDSHETTPVIRKTLEALRSYELIPFEAAITAGADAVMVGHLSYPEIDPEHIASQSPILIQNLLRDEMGFSGIVVSDDFRMDGLRKQSSLSDAAVQFILAGGDIILCGPNHDYQREILQGLYDAYHAGILSEKRIEESLIRILRAKGL